MAFADGIADFRSDTVTRPTPRMLQAMASAPVGDDVYSDDPTVNALEEESAVLTGKEAALYVPTGTMGNQLAVMAQTHPGEEVLAHEGSHVRNVEGGAPQALSGVGFRTVAGDGGRIEPEDVEQAMAMSGFFPRIGLMVWENTHNLSGGRVIPIDVMEKTSLVARAHQLNIHVDGARIFNAVIASGVPVERYAAVGDTIQFCFSKGLGAPVGSILCGAGPLITEARYLRKRLGGGMRQAGVIAAAARVALAERDRLAEDHVLARSLAQGIGEGFPDAIDISTVETNMVRVHFPALGVEWGELQDELASAGIKVNRPMGDAWRIVTHRDVDADDVQRLLTALR
ncbi:MAG TPA: GntG family PLP-dependent aldolase [Acidimicrobiia bacterium]